MAYTTLANLRAYLGITPTTDDAILTQCISRAQALIDRYCDRTFEASSDTTRYFDAERDVNWHQEMTTSSGIGYKGYILTLDYDLCQITSITNGDGTVISSSDYVKNPRNSTPWYSIQLKLSSSNIWTYSTSPENAIAIVGRWAYSIVAPSEIEHVCLRWAAYLYRQKAVSVLNTAVSTDAGWVKISHQIPVDIEQTLYAFRRLP